MSKKWPTTKRAGIACGGCGKSDTCTVSPDRHVFYCFRIGGLVRSTGQIIDDPKPIVLTPAKRKPKLPRGFATRSDALAWVQRQYDDVACVHQWDYRPPGAPDQFVVVRVDYQHGQQKTYRPIWRDGQRWRCGDPPGPLPLYRADRLEGEGIIFVTEGEKAAEAAANMGLTATTSAHGASGAGKTDFSPLAGREVVILPDNDAPGEDYGRDVTTMLLSLSPPARVRVLSLPGLPEAGDIVEFVDQGRARGESLVQLREQVERLAGQQPYVATPSATRGLLVRKLSEIEARPVEWLWENWIPLGAVTVVAGRPGTGKTWLAIELAAQVSRGGALPDGQHAPQGDVLVIQIEDSPEQTLKPRLMGAGADQEHVRIVDGVVGAEKGSRRRAFNLADIAALRDCLRSLPNCKMIVIDPLNAFVGARTDIYRDNEVRDLLGPLSELARELKLAVLLVTHHKKGVSDDADSLAMGSTGVVGLARSVIHVMEDPSDPHRRLVVPGKNNLARQQAGFAFRISEGDNPRIVWDEQRIDKNANQVARERGGVEHQRGRKPRRREEAMKWLRQRLRSGSVLATTLAEEATSLGISSSTLDRAKATLEVRSVRQAVDGPWFWSLPGSKNTEDVELAQDNLTTWSHSDALGENAAETPPATAPECDTPPKDIEYQNPMNREVLSLPNAPVLATIPRPISFHANGHSQLET